MGLRKIKRIGEGVRSPIRNPKSAIETRNTVPQNGEDSDEQLRFCVDSIADFARSGAGCRGGNHGAIFFDLEASAIKNFIARVAEIAATTIKDVAQWLVWVAKEIGKLTDMELHRADSEVGDIVDGKYDWRIEKLENHNGLAR